MSHIYNVQPSGFNQTPVLAIEEDFDENAAYEWINKNWTLSLWFSVVYVIAVFGGRHYMDKRPAFDLRSILAVWSASNAAFSILGTARTLPEMVYVIDNYGWQYSVCNSSYFLGTTKLWPFLYTISKVFELGDTLFIVLRKQNLVFLHWYHHFTVMVYTWYSYTGWQAPGRLFMVMNFAVHSFMYTYYTLKAMRFRVPKSIAMAITVLQLLQMVVGLIVNNYAYMVKNRGDSCQTTYFNLKLSVAMYTSYFILFTLFFYRSYIVKKTGPVKKVE